MSETDPVLRLGSRSRSVQLRLAAWTGGGNLAVAALVVMLLATLASWPRQFARLLDEGLPLLRLWTDPTAQQRLLAGAVPYGLLLDAHRVLPRDASVLLVTPGADVRRLEYTTYHRALYYLAPRPVWWLSPAASDGTWESRWWISAPAQPGTVRATAAARGAVCVLVVGDIDLPDLGRVAARWPGGYLLELDSGQPCVSAAAGVPSSPAAPLGLAGSLARLARAALSVGAILLLGRPVLWLARRLGLWPRRLEALALAWLFGAAVATMGMLWLSRLGLGLTGQVVALSLVALFGLALPIPSLAPTFSHALPGSGSLAASSAKLTRSSSRLRCTAAIPDRRLLLARNLLLALLAVQFILLSLTILGQPLVVWDSWVNWAMKARVIYEAGGLTPALVSDVSRAVTHLDYPLFLPLLQTWVFSWLGAPDDRYAGLPLLALHAALAVITYAALLRRGATQTLALLAATILVCLLSGLAGVVFADQLLAVLLVVCLLYLPDWLAAGTRGSLLAAALAAGLLPWTKREGLVLLGLLAALLALWAWQASPADEVGRRRAWQAAGSLLLAGGLLAGPWYVVAALNAPDNPAYLPASLPALLGNLNRLPYIGWRAALGVFGAGTGFAWPLAAVVLLAVRRNRAVQSPRPSQIFLPALAVSYLGLMAATYFLSDYVPYQQHVLSSIDRLIAHVTPLLVLAVALAAIHRDDAPGAAARG